METRLENGRGRKAKFTPGGGGGWEKVSDKKHIAATLYIKSPQTS